eukprot:CAMPEP_0173383940 /NCGR_PEP_ID=MMETSP1356-20130122/6507_1 /TAXON_ID=77927 ORGANISM="Hemiselmis virescens, Strain PCC157" /NCGR_SAMPLE_ID=MMETSP1356 /ASSEMBLY_ACC=CAM_ASM_000847 /LENGTH=181 /DNA_ID=CAMNT_0014339035 /DNA_START=26 /DNA_END=571 /DNA_ORIENTATION=-
MSRAVLAVVACMVAVSGVITLVGTWHGEGAPVELTFWEDQTGQPSPQQRWYQYMSRQDSGPPVGALGHGWDGVNRDGQFPGDWGYVEKKAKLQSLSQLDPLSRGSDSYLDAHKYLNQLRAQSVAGQMAYEAKKAAKRAALMTKGIKVAEKLYAHTLKHGYGKDLTRKYWQTLSALTPEKSG